jgi:hypothetical protein
MGIPRIQFHPTGAPPSLMRVTTLAPRGDQHVKATQYRLETDLKVSLQFHISSFLGREYELLSMRNGSELDYASGTVWYLMIQLI